LAAYLGRMSGASFAVVTNAAREGVVVGVASDHPEALPGVSWSGAAPADQERYILKSHAAGVWLLGATDLAVEHAVWDFLYRLGFRQFFPTPTWEIVPRQTNLAITVEADERPDYLMRTVGYTLTDYNRGTWADWAARNRMLAPLTVNCGHHYQAILAAERKTFEAHPEYLGLVGGARKSSKFCISNPDLRALVVDYAQRYFDRNTNAASISMEPSDGGGWCECDACAALGSISDRAVTLANEVARVMGPRGKFVGMLAYNLHAQPPSIRVESNVVVRVTTHQARGDLTLEERVRAWAGQGAVAGISEAYCTLVWDWFLPARQRGSDLVYLRDTIPSFHSWGVRIMGGWTADSWGPVGLGNYLLARFLWDISEADRTEALVDDFLDRCFGPARPPMERFYRLLYRFDRDAARPVLCEHLLGQMYRLLAEARALAPDNETRRRVDDLVLYTRYVELFFSYQNARNEEVAPSTTDLDRAIFGGGDQEPVQVKGQRQRAFEELIRFTYRIRKTEMVQSMSVYSTVHTFDDQVFIPREAGWGVPEDKNPWKTSAPFAESEMTRLLADGVANNPLLDFEPIPFTANLVPAESLNLAPAPAGTPGTPNRQRPQRFYTWVDQAPGVVRVTATCGLYDKGRGPVKLALYSPLATDAEGAPVPVSATNAPPDGQPHAVELPTPHAGLHWVEAMTLGDRVKVDIDGPCVLESGIESPGHWPVGGWSLYFYVPRGTARVAGYAAEPTGRLLDAEGREVFAFQSLGKPGYFSVAVPRGQDGKAWKFTGVTGQRLLMTVPPFLARRPEDLLLPEEVVERDRR
jgi:hypothetical protein